MWREGTAASRMGNGEPIVIVLHLRRHLRPQVWLIIEGGREPATVSRAVARVEVT